MMNTSLFFQFDTRHKNPEKAEKLAKKVKRVVGREPDARRFVLLNHDGVRAYFSIDEEGSLARTIVYSIRWPTSRMKFQPNIDWRGLTLLVPETPRRRIYYDFESTSLFDAHVLQLGVVVEEPSGEAKTHMFYVSHEGRPISPEATNVHGIDKDHWIMQQCTLSEAMSIRFLVSLARPGAIFIAHNGYVFDHRVLCDLCEQYGIELPGSVFFADTIRTVRKISPGSAKLVEAAKREGVDMQRVTQRIEEHSWQETLECLVPPSEYFRDGLIKKLKERSTKAHDALWDSVVMHELDLALRKKDSHAYYL